MLLLKRSSGFVEDFHLVNLNALVPVRIGYRSCTEEGSLTKGAYIFPGIMVYLSMYAY